MRAWVRLHPPASYFFMAYAASRSIAVRLALGGLTIATRSRGRPLLACVVVACLVFGDSEAQAQGRDPLLNGALIGVAVGAGAGIAVTHAVRDSDLVFSQYARGALIFGAFGAAAGLGVDALLNRTSPVPLSTPLRPFIAPAFWRDVGGVVVMWKW